MERVVNLLVEAGPDAIQTNIGQADLLQNIPASTSRRWCCAWTRAISTTRRHTLLCLISCRASQSRCWPALRLDAACVVCNLLLLPGEPDLHRQTVQNISRIRAACDRYGMPLMIEPLVMRANDVRGGYQVDGNKKLIVPLVRQARELGADIIKADPTDDPADYHEVIAAARCPVLVRGGGKANLEEVFQRSYAFLQQGARGLVYGRNIYQHPNPRGSSAPLWP